MKEILKVANGVSHKPAKLQFKIIIFLSDTKMTKVCDLRIVVSNLHKSSCFVIFV
jgi:hypothetical protein